MFLLRMWELGEGGRGGMRVTVLCAGVEVEGVSFAAPAPARVCVGCVVWWWRDQGGWRFEFVKLFSVLTTVFCEPEGAVTVTFCHFCRLFTGGVACQFSHDQHRKAFNCLKRGCERVEGATVNHSLLATHTVVHSCC